jgi:antirestriction protein
MTVTFTANYTEIFAADTVAKIEELVSESYALEDILEFIDNYSEGDFVTYYEDYVTAGENIGYAQVDAFVAYHGLDCVEHAEEAYQGEYDSEAAFAEEFCYQMGHDVPAFVVVDWQATWESGLRYDYDFLGDLYVFSRNF